MVVATTTINIEIENEEKQRALNTLLELWHCQMSESEFAREKLQANKMSLEEIQNELIQNHYEYDIKTGEWLPF